MEGNEQPEDPIWNGRYRSLGILADHGRTILYHCRDLKGVWGDVTVKVLVVAGFPNAEGLSPQIRNQIEEEHLERALLVGRLLKGTGLESILECGRDAPSGLPFVVRPYIPGTDLQQYLNEYGRPNLSQAIRWMSQIVEQVSLAHERDVVHFDIKPQNIILTEGKQDARLIDFGEALSAADTVQKLYRVGIRGTRGYIAPEVLKGTVVGLPHSADVYSCGQVLFTILTGNHPFHDRPRATRVELEEESNGLSTNQRLDDRYEIPPDITDRTVPSPLRDLYLRCVHSVPSERPRSVDIAKALNGLRTNPDRNRIARQIGGWSLFGILFVAGLLIALQTEREILETRPRTASKDETNLPPLGLLKNPIFRDDFQNREFSQKNWSLKTPKITRVPMQAEVRVQDGRMTLVNRGLMILKTPVLEPFALDFDWTWDEGEGTYCDDLTVCFLSHCELKSKWPHEADDGILIRFCPEERTISIMDAASDIRQARILGVEMERSLQHHVRITYHEKEIAVYFNEGDRPVLQGSITPTRSGQFMGFYNREPVGNVRKRSLIDKVTVWVPEQ